MWSSSDLAAGHLQAFLQRFSSSSSSAPHAPTPCWPHRRHDCEPLGLGTPPADVWVHSCTSLKSWLRRRLLTEALTCICLSPPVASCSLSCFIFLHRPHNHLTAVKWAPVFKYCVVVVERLLGSPCRGCNCGHGELLGPGSGYPVGPPTRRVHSC